MLHKATQYPPSIREQKCKVRPIFLLHLIRVLQSRWKSDTPHNRPFHGMMAELSGEARIYWRRCSALCASSKRENARLVTREQGQRDGGASHALFPREGTR